MNTKKAYKHDEAIARTILPDSFVAELSFNCEMNCPRPSRNMGVTWRGDV